MPFRWLKDLDDMPTLRDASLYYDRETDRYLVSGLKLNGEQFQMEWDGVLFRRKYCQPMLTERK